MFVLKIPNSNLYIGISDGFFTKVDTITQAFQMTRMGDAQSLQGIVVDTTEIVTA